MLGYEKQIELYISSLSVINAYYIGKRYNYKPEDLIRTLKMIEKFCVIAPTQQKTIHEALYSSFKDFEDATQYYSAQQAGMDVIVTRNVKDYKDSDIPVRTPDGLLMYLSENDY